jgi:hypothetical protein
MGSPSSAETFVPAENLSGKAHLRRATRLVAACSLA